MASLFFVVTPRVVRLACVVPLVDSSSLKFSVFRTVVLSVNLNLNLQSTFWCQKVAKNFSTYSISRSLPLVRKLPQAILLIRCSLAMCGFLAFIRCCETRICKQLLKHSRTFSYKCSAIHSALECAVLFKVTLHRKATVYKIYPLKESTAENDTEETIDSV